MIITKLVLHNFGVYAGTNQFQFQNKKPIVLIGGMNGRGKTTFLEGVLLALYGSNSFAYTESSYHAYGQYLKSFVNKADGTLFSYIELSFRMSEKAGEQYTVHREWSGSGQRIHEKIAVQKDGAEDHFLTENWPMLIESILPSGLSNFFFFDGEKIAELAVEDTNAQMKDSIRALLGVTVLDRLENDLSRIVANTTKASTSVFDLNELERLRSQKDYAENSLQLADEEISVLEQQLLDNRKALEKVRNIYYARGGGTATQRQDLFKEKLAINAQAKQIEDDLLNAAAGELPFCLIRDLLEEICVQAEKEHEQSVTRSALDKISFMSEQFLAFQQTDSASIQHFIDFMKCSAEKEYIEPIYKLTDQAWYQAKHLQKHQLKNARKRTANMMAQFQNLREQESKIDSYLSVDIDESTLTRIYKKIKALEQTEIDLSVQLEAKRKRRVSLHSEAIRTNTDYNRFAESVLKNLESSDDSNRIANYSQRAIRVLEKYRICLQKNKADLLAKTMTDCYKKIASKKNLIDRINMDPVSLDFQYINAEGEVVPKASLSAGEKQLMVISLLWSLAICSKWKLPVIIDTPLSRLDSIHRLALITSYFPHASDQTIILSTDSEINQYYYEAMKESVGDEFTLVYDEERKCSVIKKGYFVGAQSCL